MGASIGVVRPRPWWAPWRAVDLDPAVVRTVLGRVLGDDPGFAAAFEPEAADRVPPYEFDEAVDPALLGGRRVAELTWSGRRVGGRWSIHFHVEAVRRVTLVVWDRDPHGPLRGYREELTAVLGALRELAGATGARILVDGGDVTDEPLAAMVDLLA